MPASKSSQSLNQFEHAVLSTTRAIAKKRTVEIGFGGEYCDIPGSSGRLPNVTAGMTRSEVACLRGMADAYALRQRYHDPSLHEQYAPDEHTEARNAYEAMEQARVEAIGASRMPGVASNLAAMLQQYFATNQPGSTLAPLNTLETQAVPYADILRLLVRERLSQASPPESAFAAMNQYRSLIESRAALHLDAMIEHIGDQEAFSRISRKVIADLGLAMAYEAGTANQSDSVLKASGLPDDIAKSSDSGEQDSRHEQEDEKYPESDVPRSHHADIEPAGFVPEIHVTDQDQGQNHPSQYSVFTTEYDEVIAAQDLGAAAELAFLRHRLDQQLRDLHCQVSRLANRLQRVLMAQQVRSWNFDLDEGILDASRLNRVVTNPLRALSFKREHEADFKDTAITLLIDNSGSMRGRSITIAAICADILARTLERCGVKVEISGFTTRAWRGGNSRMKWQQQGKPYQPGRLTDLRHIIYKTADSPWRRARNNLGLMLRESLLKENIDGEALRWAHSRLLHRPEQRRILLVISDGAPEDDSTLSTNSTHFLEDHLRTVIDRIEKSSPVELLAIGIGHDVTRYYHKAMTIMDTCQLGSAITEQLADLLDNRSRKAREDR